ncbi:MAG: hypothetical protein HQL13_07030 [Candidatus Omnitrophica bacterium]|nr:hypothetical protein [Candidatus Omnitrophota bacterium]
MTKSIKIFIPCLIGLIICIGLFLRLYHISANQFLFYDEGMYLGYNRPFLELVAKNPAHNMTELAVILSLMFKAALTTAKALWFFILNLRVFVFGADAWYVARWISAMSGLACVALTFFWAKRYFNSRRIAALSALILLVLPSHVFYSRLGMQESLCTFLFLSAVYLYQRQKGISWSFFVSVVLMACVYLTNYRMIIAPVFILFIEVFNAFIMKNKFDWKGLVIYGVCFYGLVLFVGSLYGWINLQANFSWMTLQAQDAGGKLNLVNFLSYPYDVFVLEGLFFACFFWANIYLIKLKEYAKLLPFGLVVLQMMIFSFAAEKGARYLCVVLPFMASASALMVDDFYHRLKNYRYWFMGFGALTVMSMLYVSFSITFASTDYEQALRGVLSRDSKSLIVSTQPLVEGLFLDNDKQIVPCPHDAYALLNLYKNGARFLIIDPQAYVSWTSNKRRFSPPLEDFLEVAVKEVRPVETFDHLNKVLLMRFVLDHNEQILDSIRFLSQSQRSGYGKIRVYDIKTLLSAVGGY